jgi:hypothetical protein
MHDAGLGSMHGRSGPTRAVFSNNLDHHQLWRDVQMSHDSISDFLHETAPLIGRGSLLGVNVHFWHLSPFACRSAPSSLAIVVCDVDEGVSPKRPFCGQRLRLRQRCFAARERRAMHTACCDQHRGPRRRALSRSERMSEAAAVVVCAERACEVIHRRRDPALQPACHSYVLWAALRAHLPAPFGDPGFR